MKGWQELLTLAVCLSWMTGCKGPQHNLALERELRYQEDMIFQLQDYVHTYKSYLDECRKENQRLRGNSPTDNSTSPSRNRGAADAPNIDLSPPEVQLPGDASEDFEPPTIDLPGADPQTGANTSGRNDSIPGRHRTPPQRSVLREPTPADAEVELTSYEVSDPVVTRLSLNTEQSGGYQVDAEAGADGLYLLIEPRNAQDEIVPPVGALSVALLDPKATNAADARVARWHFEAEQVALIAEDFRPGRGLALELQWPAQPPMHHRLHVYLRLVTAEGKRLIIDREIDLSRRPRILQASATEEVAPGDGIDEPRWKPRTRPRLLPDTRTSTPIRSPAASEMIPPKPRPRMTAQPKPPVSRERATHSVDPSGERTADTRGDNDRPPRRMTKPHADEEAPPKRIRRPRWTPYR